MRCLTTLLLAGLVAGCASRTYTEAEFKQRPSYADCVAGDCKNGLGTQRYPDGTEITGARVNGEQVAGTYDIRWPCLPGKTLSLTYDTEKRPVSGTVVRACVSDSSALSKAPRAALFFGTFANLSNPFTRESVSSYKSGSYTDTRGVIWEGEFDYIPIRNSVELPGYGKTFLRSGAFVFVGVKIDPEFDEVVRGLFISEPTRPEEDIRLIRARPDYLESLRSTFVEHRALNAADLAEEKRASREAFNTFLSVAASTAVIYANAQAMAAADRATLDSMTGLIRGERQPSAAAGTRVSTARANTTSGNTPSPISVAEFRKLQGTANSATVIQQSGAGDRSGTGTGTISIPTTPQATASSGEKSQPPVESLIVESNPYVVDQRPDRWRDRMRAPWRLATGLSPGSGWTRGDACGDATRRGKDTIEMDKSQGLIVVTEGLTNCVCHNGGSTSPIRRLWLCDVYFQYKSK
jgi:hypothetical protein